MLLAGSDSDIGLEAVKLWLVFGTAIVTVDPFLGL